MTLFPALLERLRLPRDWPWPVVAAGLVGLALCFSTTWRAVELWSFDELSVRTAPYRADLPITILSIDEESMGAIGKQWPWPRSIHARVVDNLKEAGVAVVAFDVVFAEPDSRPEEDAEFARAIRNFGRVILATSAPDAVRLMVEACADAPAPDASALRTWATTAGADTTPRAPIAAAASAVPTAVAAWLATPLTTPVAPVAARRCQSRLPSRRWRRNSSARLATPARAADFPRPCRNSALAAVAEASSVGRKGTGLA